MTQRTCNIIMCCKGNSKWSSTFGTVDCIKKYMGNECAYPWSEYNDNDMRQILEAALLDFVGTADNHRYIWWCFLEALKRHDVVTDAIISTLCNVQVRDGETNNLHCINGFTEELIAQSEIDLNKEETK